MATSPDNSGRSYQAVLLRFGPEEWPVVEAALRAIDAPVKVGPFCKDILLRALRRRVHRRNGIRAAS